jgi:hypothetical protein
MKPISSSPAAERRINRACRYVTDLWFPANPQLVSKLRTTLEQGPDQTRLEDSLLLVEEDFSLFMYALKETAKLLSDEGVAIPKGSSPSEILRLAGVERLQKIFDDSDDNLSRHFFDGMGDLQVSRMREAMVSASASAQLAAAQSENKELGFFGGLLRQLGLTLIAWNYPSVYQRAALAVKEGKTFDHAIAEILGFSPTMLAFGLAHEWRLPEELLMALDEDGAAFDYDAIDEEMETNAVGASMRELCCIGEALARANEPEVYPTARYDWEFARNAITEKLGGKGLESIREALVEKCAHYEVSIPSFFRGGLILDPEVLITRATSQDATEKNPFILKCRPHLQERLFEIYHNLADGQSVQALLRKIAQDLVPTAGFSGGTVFTVDPTQDSLMPQLRIGTTVCHDAAPVRCTIDEHKDFVALAYQDEKPIARVIGTAGGLEMAQLGVVIGYSQRVGVLYLEMPKVAFKNSEAENLNHLKAIAVAITDVLHLG